MAPNSAGYLAALILAGLGAPASGGEPPKTAQVQPGGDIAPDGKPPELLLPERLLQCDLSHPLNLDPTRDQDPSEVRYEGHHRFTLNLPAIRERTAPPPDPIDPPEPVDPHTRVLFDPDRLIADVPDHFDRVVDYWPKRVELSTNLPGGLYHVIIISNIDPVQGTAMLFMTHAIDTATLDLKHVYSGPCQVKRPTT